MTVPELLSIPAEKLAAMSDAELTSFLTSLIPAARAEYIGPRTATVVIGGKAVSRREYAKREAMIQSLLKQYNQ